MARKKADMTFGELVRNLREEQDISLRSFAEKVDISPTYLSRLERDKFPPPAKEKVEKIAQVLGCDLDALLGAAGYAASDVQKIINEQPKMATFLRTAQGISAESLEKLIKEAERLKNTKE